MNSPRAGLLYEDPDGGETGFGDRVPIFTVYAYLGESNRERRPGRIASKLVQGVEGRGAHGG